MKKKEIIDLLNKSMTYKNIQFKVDDKVMDQIAIDVSRVADEKFTNIINCIKINKKIKISSLQKEKIRKFLIGYPVNLTLNLAEYVPKISDSEYEKAYSLISEGFKRNRSTMINSLIARIEKVFLNRHQNNTEKYLEYIKEIQKGKKQLLIIQINADDEYTADNIAEIIEKKYNDLSNYHHAIIIFKDGEKTTDWSTVAKISLFMEQFKKEHNFKVYERKNKERRIKELERFISDNKHVKLSLGLKKKIEEFYDGVAYGFQFEDLFISNNGNIKILVMQKVQLDEEPKKCPECLESIVRGNSYPKILYKSFECQNPSCPSRSKIGRGKRYDLFGAKRQIMLSRNSRFDRIDEKTYSAFRRDIVKEKDISIERLILLYSWAGDSVEIINSNFTLKKYKSRTIETINYNNFDNDKRYSTLPFIQLFRSIARSLEFKSDFEVKDEESTGSSYEFNGNSTDLIPFINQISSIKKFGGAVTSPPYYNAREYSQWTNLLCYLVDMMANAKAVYKKLDSNGMYIYNIGDIVGQDNIYIRSNMSKRRQMLGFYSIAIFEEVGYKVVGNIIWDKGEVQSKRNSTPNHLSGYVKPVNSYEHCLVFCGNLNADLLSTEVKQIEAVKKINSKGENILGHTAPYPIEIPKLIIPFVRKNDYVVDPFLGSGTTVIALKEEGYKSVGFELDKIFFNLALSRIKETKSRETTLKLG